jgi:uracil-DNA glycosylase family 4
MNSQLRREYLDALGLKSWTLRGKPAPGAPSLEIAPAAAASAAPAPAPVRTPAPAPARTPAPAPARDVSATREAGADWDELRARVAACTRCSLSATRTQTVFGVGNPHADWLIVGEAPGAEEDRRGEPFVGRAGQLLNSMLHAIGLAREQVYIANVLKCRPPGNRDPSPIEAAECLPYLERQIALLKPKIMLAVGRIAAQNLLRTDKTLGALRKQVHRFGLSDVPLVVTYHPAYLLRTPTEKRKAWEDLKFARDVVSRV